MGDMEQQRDRVEIVHSLLEQARNLLAHCEGGDDPESWTEAYDSITSSMDRVTELGVFIGTLAVGGCPGCGCLPGDGLTPNCTDETGCGRGWRDALHPWGFAQIADAWVIAHAETGDIIWAGKRWPPMDECRGIIEVATADAEKPFCDVCGFGDPESRPDNVGCPTCKGDPKEVR